MNSISNKELGSDDMATWKMFIKAGNSSFEYKQTLTAIAYYQKAILLSERIFKNWQDIRTAVSTMVVSHHNLADLFLREGTPLLAEKELRSVHRKLSLSLSEAAPNTPKVDALLWGVSRTYFALVSHVKNHPHKVMSLPVTPPSSLEVAFKNNRN